jgi:hypothetical protein
MLAGLRALLGTSPQVPPPDPADAAVALVAVGEKWAEFAILRGDTLLQARTLSPGPGLAAEIRRNLAVHSGQQSQAPVEAVYLALSGEQAALREKLVQLLDVPVHPFDPFAGAEGKELPASGRGTFVGAVGLLRLMARGAPLPVNFVQVKQPRPPRNPNQRLHVLIASLVAVLLLGGLALGLMKLADMRKEIREKNEYAEGLTNELTFARKERARMQALYDWESVSWPDELYELVRTMPKITDSFKVRKLEGAPDKSTPRQSATAANQRQSAGPPSLDELSGRPVARFNMELNSPGPKPLEELANNLYHAGDDRLGAFYRPEPHAYSGGTWKKAVKIRLRAPDDYTEPIKAP